MKSINKSELKIIRQFNYGSFSHVFEVIFDGKLYCYKQFKREYPNDILQNICEMTEESYSSEFVIPLLIVFDNGKIVGYLSNLINAVELDDIYDMKKKKLLLRQAKLTLQKLHKEYERIHGDINHANIIYDENAMKPYIIDFDSSLKFGQEIKSTFSFPDYLLDYLQYFPFDYFADIYEFNLQTLVLLARKNHKDLLKDISEGIYPFEEEFGMARKLCKELTLCNTRRKISGEFIIDYL